MPEALPTLGRYQLVERLAMGGMAELFKATMAGAHDFEKTVVIKKILPALAADPEFVEMFITEAKVLSLLQHPKIVQIFELGNIDSELFIAMEFVRGTDLLRVLRAYSRAKQVLPEHLAVHIVSEVLDALDYAHKATDDAGQPLGIVHRDISPGNILLSHGGVVKLTDFGIVRVEADTRVTQSGTIKGKCSYMSPEQVGNEDLDERSDLFSIAVVLAEIVMCRRLFIAPSELDVLIMVREADLGRLGRHGGQLHPRIREILLRALAKKPDDRFQTAREFRDALEEWQFDAGKRVTSRDISELVRTVIGPDDVGPDEVADERTATLSGHATGAPPGRPGAAPPLATTARQSLIELAIDGGWGTPADDDPEMDVLEFGPDELPAEPPAREGSFADVSPIRAMFELAVHEATGLLVARKDNIVKQAYFVGGQVEFVDSNLPGERFGAYLVRNEVITSAELNTALRVLPQFNGRLGDALIELGMISPMRALQCQTEQVRAKIVDIATWIEGHYAWYQDKRREDSTIGVLHLDAFDILGAASERLDVEYLAGWAHQRAQLAPRVAHDQAFNPIAFRLGSKPSEILAMLDGTPTLFDLNASFPTRDSRVEAMRILYLLIHTGLAEF